MAAVRSDSRPRRVAVYGFHHPELIPAIDALVAGGVWEVPLWYGSGSGRRWTEDVAAWHLGCLQSDSADESPRAADGADGDLDPAALDAFLDQVARNPAMIDQPFAEYRRLWQRLLRRFDRQLRSANIDRVVFQNLPHEGFEWALYQAARRRSVETLLLYQTVLPNRFCFCWDLADFGWFVTVTADERRPVIEIERRFEKDLFYMRDALAENRSVERFDLAGTWNALRVRWRRGWRDWKAASGWDWLRGKSERPVHPDEDYRAQVHRLTRPVDWRRPFVYFPLHLQPELTTATLGDQYRDQLAALENLRAALDPEVWIYVKENPKQSWRWRGPAFFERLRQIPRTLLVDRSCDTYRLLRESQFAATVTGTVGWESVSGGKPVLVFGRPWYLSLAGVHRFGPDVALDDLRGARIDPAAFDASLANLCRKMPVGLVDLAYRAMVPDYRADENCNRLVEFLQTVAPMPPQVMVDDSVIP